jgi:iron complex outermembrane recepter protein
VNKYQSFARCAAIPANFASLPRRQAADASKSVSNADTLDVCNERSPAGTPGIRIAAAWILVFAISILVGTATTATGATPGETSGGETTSAETIKLETIVVEARRRRENLQDVPISITALPAEDLKTYHLGNSTELQNYVPNLTINGAFGSTNPQIFIRGVGNNDYNDNAGATVGVYLDGVFLNAPAGKLLQMFDLESVQVLRGPQGTLFGKNNTAGAILFSSVKPGKVMEGHASTTIGNYGQRDTEAALTLPISDRISSRVSINTRNLSGWGETHDAEDRFLSKIGRIDEFAGRAQLRWQPGEATDILLNLNHSETNDDRLPGRAIGAGPDGSDNAGWINPSDNIRVNYSNYKEVERVKTDGAFVDVNQDFGAATLTSISGLWDSQRYVTLDVDKSPLNTLQLSRNPEAKQYSEEIRLASNAKSSFQWVAGALFFKEILRVQNLWDFGGFADPRDANIPQFYSNNSVTKALFAESIIDLNRMFSLTVGGRYSIDDKDFAMNFPAVGIIDQVRSRQDKNFSGRAILDQKFTDNFSLYYSVGSGFQGGGYNGGAFGVADIGNGYAPEKLLAYEIGWKSQLLDNRLQFNGATFYYQYRDIQVFSLAATSTGALSQTIANASKGRLFGLDAEFKALVTERFTVGAGLGLLDSKYLDPTLGLYGYKGQFLSGYGNSFISAPKVNLNLSSDYSIPLNEWGIKLHGDYDFRTKRDFDITARPLVSGGAYGLLNARAAIGPRDGNWDIALWGKNLLNKEYVSFVADLSGSAGFYETYYGAPRQYGVQISARYK